MAEAESRVQFRENLVFGAIYTGFFLLVFFVSAYLTFPYDRLRDLITSRASTSGPVGARTVTIGELQPVGMGGVRLKDVEIVQAATPPTDPPSVMHFDELTVHISPFALLFGEKRLSVDAAIGGGTPDASVGGGNRSAAIGGGSRSAAIGGGRRTAAVGGGRIESTYVESSSGRKIKAELSMVDIAQLGLDSYVGLPLKGKASGSVDLTIPVEATKSSGSIKLEIKGLHLGDGKAKIKIPALGSAGLTVDEIDAGKLELGVQVQDEVATLTRFATDGKDLRLNGKGGLRLVDPFKRSRPDITLDLSFSQAFRTKSDRTKAMFEIIGMRPEWQRATTPDGTLRVHLGGTLQLPRGGPAR